MTATAPRSSPARDLADALAERLLAADPFQGTALGLREYDALVPDPSAAAEQELARDLAALATQAETVTALDDADAVTLATVRDTCARYVSALANRPEEYTVTAMPFSGPPALLATFARTTLVDGPAAEDYLTRVRASVAWIDGVAQRLREGAAAGRFPVGSLLDQALAWVERRIAEGVPGAVLAPEPPDGWPGAAAWRAELEAAGREQVVPALARWRDRLLELRPSARPDDRPGLCGLPDGALDYARAIAQHTTLTLTAEELHRIGLERVTELAERARELGDQLGLDGVEAVRDAARASSAELAPEAALERALEAVRRAETRAGEIMPAPLPEPCAVSPMPPTVADAGTPAHYTRPRQDGSRPGTYWFNTRRPGAGAGWDIEVVAFHEAVPGHHSQLARSMALADLPLLQQFSVTAHAEGWGLYAERLAGEFGLYSDVRAEIGAVYSEMHRAARLVVDTGLHAFGWSREQAVRFLLDNVAMPESTLRAEVDRYIGWPGQALAYLVGQRELLRLRERARSDLGAAFDLPAFNGAVLDHGSISLPVLATVVDRWIAARRPG